MKVIVGTAGTGKSFILASEALESSKENKIVIYTNNPKEMFTRLGMVAGSEKILGITVVKVKNTQEVIKHLLLNKESFGAFYADTDDIGLDNTAYFKLKGFALGSGIDLTITWKSNLNGNAGRVTLYDDSSDELITIKDYTRGIMNNKIREWTKTVSI